MKNPRNMDLVITMALVILLATPTFAENARSLIPFGGYLEQGKCGCYGAKTAIKTADEARKVVEEFLVGHDLHTGSIDERPNFFKVDLLDRNGIVQDVVIVHKDTGRVRLAH